MTLRKQLIELLSEYSYGARELSQLLHIREKEVYNHLEHVEKTIKKSGGKLIIEPAECLNCEFVFKERRRFSPPGQCPKCRKTHITAPSYRIR